MSHFYADVINGVFSLLSDHQMSPNLTHCSFKSCPLFILLTGFMTLFCRA